MTSYEIYQKLISREYLFIQDLEQQLDDLASYEAEVRDLIEIRSLNDEAKVLHADITKSQKLIDHMEDQLIYHLPF